MPLPLKNLDTRRYPELVDDAHALIPRYAPSWTDHNESDPGITVLELLAWLVEQDLYRTNRVPARHRRKFLELAGVTPEPPRAAQAVLALRAPAPVTVPAGTLFQAGDVPFTSTADVHVADVGIAAVQSWDGQAYADQSASWRDGLRLPALGVDPTGIDDEQPPALLLGFEDSLPQEPLSVWLAFEGGGDPSERARIAAEDEAARTACEPLRPRATCEPAEGEAVSPTEPCCDDCLEVVWEQWEGGEWHELQVNDPTEALLLDGIVTLHPHGPGDPLQLGAVPQPLRWLRCRASSGTPDAAPTITGLALNAVAVAQRVPATSRLALAPGADLPAPALSAGERARLTLAFDVGGRVTRVRRSQSPEVPEVRVVAVSATELELTLVVAGSGLGIPELSLEVEGAPVADGEIGVWSDDDGWSVEPDLDAARPRTRAFVLEAQSGTLAFGDGEHGLAPRAGTTLLATFDSTRAGAGNVPGGAAWDVPAFAQVAADPCTAAGGGRDAEDRQHAEGRAAERLWSHERLLDLAAGRTTLDGIERGSVVTLTEPQRAATALDFERLALTVPGARVTRARAWPEIDGSAPGLRAPGTVTVVVLSSLPAGRPAPSACLIDRVHAYLARRKTLGTRLVVCGPGYVEVTARATLAPARGADPAGVSERALDRLAAFLDPLRWPFGRDVFRSEVLALLDGVEGVDAVTALELMSDGGEPSCGNVCIGPVQLPVSGQHEVEVSV